MRVFITGGAGFIGSYLVERLLKEHSIKIFDNLSSGKEEHVPIGKVQFVRCDLLNKIELKRQIAGSDLVIHLAANPNILKGITQTDLDLNQNTIVTYNVLDAMRQEGVKKIIFASSSVVYGEPSTIPTPENYAPLHPISLYGASKLACEGLITAYCHVFGLQAWIFRFANVTGKRHGHGIIHNFQEKYHTGKLPVLGNGYQAKSYLHVNDCIDGILHGFKNSNESVNVFNLGTKDQICVRDIVEIWSKYFPNAKAKYGKEDRGWPGDVNNMLLDCSKINKLGWKPKLNSYQAMDATIAEIKGTGHCQFVEAML